MKLSIQKALLPDAMPIARLLDEVTVQLHQKGILQWEHPWDPDKIGQDLLLERVWACRDGTELVGTFSLRPLHRFYSSANFDTIGIFPEENYQTCVFSRHFREEG